MRKAILLVYLIELLISPLLFADVIELKTGEKRQGEIVERTDEYIKIQIKDIPIPITYFLTDIAIIREGVYIRQDGGNLQQFQIERQEGIVYENERIRKEEEQRNIELEKKKAEELEEHDEYLERLKKETMRTKRRALKEKRKEKNWPDT